MTQAKPEPCFHFADLSLDVGRHQLSRSGEPIALTRRTFALLRLLVECAPNLVTHAEIADRVWGSRRVVTPENIAQHVRMLRRALGDDASAPRYVEVVRGAGYRFVPRVQAGEAQDGPAPIAGRRRVPSLRALAAAGFAGAVAVALAVAFVWPPTRHATPRVLASPADELVRVLTHGGEGLAGIEAEAAAPPPPRDREAYDLYSEALEWMGRSGSGGYDKATALLARAIELQPDFAYARTMRAWLLAQTVIDTAFQDADSVRDWQETQLLVFDEAKRALTLDPGLGRAYVPMADIHESTWRWADARAAYDRALALTPEDPYVLYRFGWFSAFAGDDAKAFELARRETEVQPEFFHSWLDLGVAELYAGHLGKAATALDQASVLEPGDLRVRLLHGLVNALRRDAPAAEAQLRSVERLLADQRLLYFLPQLAIGYAAIDRQDDVARLVAEIEAAGRDHDIGAGNYALAYLAAGDEQTARNWLEAAADEAIRNQPDRGYFALMLIKQNVFALPVLEQPRFRELRAQLGAF